MAQCWILGLTGLPWAFQQGSFDCVGGSISRPLQFLSCWVLLPPTPNLFHAQRVPIAWRQQPRASGEPGSFTRTCQVRAGGPAVALRSNVFPAKPRSFAPQSHGSIYSVSSLGSPEAVTAARLVCCSQAEPSVGETLGGQPSAARCE